MKIFGQRLAPPALPPEQRPGTHFIGGWMGSGTGLDGFRKSRLYRDLFPGKSSP